MTLQPHRKGSPWPRTSKVERPPAPNRSTIAFATPAEQFIAWQGHLRQHVDSSIERVDHGAAWSMYFSDPDEITCYAVDELKRLGAPRG